MRGEALRSPQAGSARRSLRQLQCGSGAAALAAHATADWPLARAAAIDAARQLGGRADCDFSIDQSLGPLALQAAVGSSRAPSRRQQRGTGLEPCHSLPPGISLFLSEMLAFLALTVLCGACSGLNLLMALPSQDFDPSEAAIPWLHLTATAQHTVHFVTPDGKPASADPVMLTGKGLGLFSYFLRAGTQAVDAYARLVADANYNRPLRYDQLDDASLLESMDGLILPGGHAPGMRVYLESGALQRFVGAFFASGKPVAAVCHGVVLAARSRRPDTGLSALHGRRTTALPRHMELAAQFLTNGWFVFAHTGNYYRTYPDTSVQDEVSAALGPHGLFEAGPGAWSLDSILRDSYDSASGFVVVDGTYVSARWPGDANTFAAKFEEVLSNYYAMRSLV